MKLESTGRRLTGVRNRPLLQKIGFVVRRDRTGMMQRMKESYRKGVVTHPDPESYTASREAGGEA